MPVSAAAPKSPLDTTSICQTAMDDRERMDAAGSAQDNSREISLARATIEDSELCRDKLPANDRFEQDEALVLETYGMEVLDTFAMDDSTVANPSVMLVEIEANVREICSDTYSGMKLNKDAPLSLVFLDLNIVTGDNVPQDISDCKKHLWKMP